ncbi:MAG: hypothetical protein HOE90_22345 [Bacteriovoracaceae bacterium]|nr:hypothetical protein [Bacteriovoracaceae bacterium]
MKKVLLFISLLSNLSYASVAQDSVIVTGIVYKYFDKKTVQIKDQFDQVMSIPRDLLPKQVKIYHGQIVSFSIDPKFIKFQKKKKKKKKKKKNK